MVLIGFNTFCSHPVPGRPWGVRGVRRRAGLAGRARRTGPDGSSRPVGVCRCSIDAVHRAGGIAAGAGKLFRFDLVLIGRIIIGLAWTRRAAGIGIAAGHQVPPINVGTVVAA